MAVVGGKHSSHFKVADNRQVDEKTKNPRTDEIPDPDGHQKVEGPLVGHRNLPAVHAAASLGQFYEIPGIEGQKRQGDDLSCQASFLEKENFLGQSSGLPFRE